MDEEMLCRKLEDRYEQIVSLAGERGKAFDIHVEWLSYLVLVAGSRSNGSDRLDNIFSAIQKQSPTLAVPRYVMSPGELEEFIDDLAADDPNDLAYSAYRRKARSMSELIANAKKSITRRSGFAFDPSVPVVRSQ
ncbi:MAG: hypothetical protein HRU01_29545 [Myxococcales bacterium]|nr:hypothetical protein [Myxococcales bacterium]